jgi:hypothetical protein
MSLLYCAVCLKDFVNASARTKHEATCKDPPLDHAELTKLVYKLKRKVDDLEKKLNDSQKEVKDLKRSRVGAPAKGKPGPFPELTETDLWDFWQNGIECVIRKKEWPAYVDEECFMIYKKCEETNEEGWKEASSSDTHEFYTKIYGSLNKLFNLHRKKMEKTLRPDEGLGELGFKIGQLNFSDIKRALENKGNDY